MNDEELIERIIALNYREFGANVGNDLKRIIIKKEDELERYKNIVDKAIEYIEKWKFEVSGNGACMEYEDIKELLHILQGKSDE